MALFSLLDLFNPVALAMGIIVPLYVLVTYLLVKWDQSRGGSSAGDTQVGLKAVMYGIGYAGLTLAVTGVLGILAYLLSGANGSIKPSIASLLSGAIVAFGAMFMMSGTNFRQYRYLEKAFWGAVALFGFGAFFFGLNTFLNFVFNGFDGWKVIGAPMFATLLVGGATTFFGLRKLGVISGWTAPKKVGFPPAGGGGHGHHQPMPTSNPTVGYPVGEGPPSAQPQGGGYVPPGGGYTPPGSGGMGGPPPAQ